MGELAVAVSDAKFEDDVIQSDLPVLVDFWAPWCGPCKMLAPVLEEVAQDYQGRVKVLKMNVDENEEIPVKYGVRSIPTLLLFQGGNIIANHTGALSKSQLAAMLDQHIGS